jgi:hypothetical protein
MTILCLASYEKGPFSTAGIDLGDALRNSDARRSLAAYDHALQHLAEVQNNSPITPSSVARPKRRVSCKFGGNRNGSRMWRYRECQMRRRTIMVIDQA